MNEISSKQLYIMIFFIPLVFKMSSLPALMYGAVSATAYVLIGLVVVVEFLQLMLVLFVSKQGGMDGIKEKYGKKAYCAVAFPMLFVVFVKMLVLTQEIVNYVCSFMFYNIAESAVVPVVMLVIFYLGTRGAKAIGRMFELSVWLIPFIVVFGAVFGKAELETSYLTPIFDGEGKEYLSTIGKYLIFTFDFSPLLFFKPKIKKIAPITVCSILSTGSVVAAYAVLFSVYGTASEHASFGFTRLATFSTVISEIGSLDWPSVMLWLIAGILSLSLKINAVNEISGNFGTKKAGTFAFCVAITIVLLTAIKTPVEAIRFASNGLQYAVFGIEIALPFVLLTLYAAKKSRSEEYAAQN